YHRLSVFAIHLPPLRERPADIAPMAEALLRRAAAELGRPPLRLSDEARALLVAAELRGNIRELKNVLERAAIMQALGETSGNRRLAAERLGIGVRTLYDKLKRYGLG